VLFFVEAWVLNDDVIVSQCTHNVGAERTNVVH